MSKSKELQPPPPSGDALDPTRRMMLTAIGGSLGALAVVGAKGGSANADEDKSREGDSQVFTAYERQREFVNNEMDGIPWKAAKTGNFDLEDPHENHLAKLKMTNNLVGRRTYIPMLTRQLVARENLPGGLLLGIASMFTWQLQVPDPEEFPGLPEGTALMRSMYTAIHLDPNTMEPVKTLKNPFNGKLMELEDYIFVENFLSFPLGGSRFIEELQFADDDPNKPRPSLIKKWGDDLVLFLGGVYREPGRHQPRFTENTWRCASRDVMDPDVSLIQTNYNFLGINKAFEKPWAGYTFADTDSLCSLATGKKVHSPEDLPDFHKRVLAEKYPDRL